MNYQEEFERLLDIAEQALAGVDIETRRVPGFAGLFVLDCAVKEYRRNLTRAQPDAAPLCADGDEERDAAQVSSGS